MALSRKSIEQLLDLTENKLGTLAVIDRNDALELDELELARDELLGLLSVRQSGIHTGQVIPFPY